MKLDLLDLLKICLRQLLDSLLGLIANAVALVVGGFIGAFAGVNLVPSEDRIRAMFIGGIIGALLFLFIRGWLPGKFKRLF